MSTTTSAIGATRAQASFSSLALASLLGLFIIGFVGFSHLEIAHNAGHDYRHSMAFPCH